MLKPKRLSFSPSPSVLDSIITLQPIVCLQCHHRYSSFRHYATSSSSEAKKTALAPAPPSTNAAPKPSINGLGEPKAKGHKTKDGEAEHIPVPLPRPIGMPDPPQPGENTGIDRRTFRQRRDDFVNYDKHLERRRQLTRQYVKPYFRDWTLLRYHEGKTFLAPPRLFRSPKSLYLPNLHGVTLASPGTSHDTTPSILNRVSVVAIWSSLWGENQAITFIGDQPDQNPRLHDIVRGEGEGVARIVRVNVETNWFKAFLVKMFMGKLRRRFPEEEWGTYFLVRKGLSDEIRGALGAVNMNVAYVYLVDWEGKIRWAGCGNAAVGEVNALNAGVRKLVEQWKAGKTEKGDPVEDAVVKR